MTDEPFAAPGLKIPPTWNAPRSKKAARDGTGLRSAGESTFGASRDAVSIPAAS